MRQHGVTFRRWVVTSLHRDFLPSSWVMYTPTIIEVVTLAGTFGLFVVAPATLADIPALDGRGLAALAALLAGLGLLVMRRS